MKGLRISGSVMLTVGLAVMLSGCWDLVEVNRSSLLTGLAIELKDDGKKKVTFEVLNTAEAQALQGGEGGSPTTLYTSEGYSIADTAGKLNEKLERLLITSHNRVIILDESLARTGLQQYLDLLQRSRYVREDVTILVAQGVPASDLLKVIYPGRMYASLKIQSQVENLSKIWGGIPKSRLFDITQAFLSEGMGLTLGAVTLQGNVDASEKMESVRSVVPKAVVKLNGSAVFREDKLVGFLPVTDTRNMNLVRNDLDATSISLPLGTKGAYAALRYKHRNTRIEVALRNGKPLLSVYIEGEGQIASIDGDIALDQVKGYMEMERMMSAYLNEQVKATITRVQREFGVDIFGFGQHLYRYHYRQFKPIAKEWNERFAKADVKVTSKIYITNSDLKTRRLVKDGNGS